MTRSDLEKYQGWAIDSIGGDITDFDEREIKPSRVRLQLKSPTGEYVNVYIESDENEGGPHLTFSERAGRAPWTVSGVQRS